mmetsp:Transcript_21428/g.43813  ORF Transcript_21428/g.43813 Transcript_21428/m.43813 type:complete len:214 (+) Transcript_21428:99-740(+)
MGPCVAYRLGRTIYLALTNSCNTVSLIASRGPGFVIPPESGFAPLPEGFTPSAKEVHAAAVDAAAKGEYDSIAFAGIGEPLLRLSVLEESARLLEPLGVPLRLNTNGLVTKSGVKATAQRLSDAGLSQVSVALATAHPQQYATLMKPEKLRCSPVFSLQLGHAEVTDFVEACVAVGLEVECTAVAAPDVDLQAVETLAKTLGAGFRARSWHSG